MSPLTIVGLILIACLSPLLTLATLWQKKEWRIDRLREHLRAEGGFRQLFGIIRPLLAFGAIFIHITWGIFGLAALSVLQIISQRQRYPVWTMKAMVLIGTSILITSAATFHFPLSLPVRQAGTFHLLLPLFQSVPLLIAWVLFLPVDYALKKHIMTKAATLRGEYTNCTVIGITGSVGKTTTKELLKHITKSMHVLCTPAYVNSEMGVAKWLIQELSMRDRTEELILIVEMGAYRIGEIARLCTIAQPHIGVITYIGTQHIALFGSQKKLQNAKAELVFSLPKNGHAFLNADNPECAELGAHISCPYTTVGINKQCTIDAKDIEETEKGIRFKVDGTLYNVPLHGTHNVTNVLLAIAVAKHLKIDIATIKKQLSTFVPPHSTFAVRKDKGVTILDDTHNASPESFKAAIAWAKSQPAKNKILLTPGLIELGSAENAIHTELGMHASGIFSRVIFTGKHGIDAFAKGYTGEVTKLSKQTRQVQEGDLLLCIGRISKAVISRILP